MNIKEDYVAYVYTKNTTHRDSTGKPGFHIELLSQKKRVEIFENILILFYQHVKMCLTGAIND